MKVGVRVPPSPPFDRMRRFVARLVEGGVDSLWWSDHLMSFWSAALWEDGGGGPDELAVHVFADPFVCMAACAAVSGNADVGVCVTDGIRRMPASLLQSALSVDHVVDGRVILGLGSGERANYEPYGWDVASPAARFEDAATQIRRFLDDPGPDEAGAVVALRGAKADRRPHLWLAAHGPRGLSLTGRCADGWIPTGLTASEWERGRDAVRAAATEAGRGASTVSLGLSLDVVTSDTHAEAHRLLDHPAVRLLSLMLPSSVFAAYGSEHPLGGSGLHRLVPTRMGSQLTEAARRVPMALLHDRIVHGTPEEVVAAIRRYDGLEHVRLSDLGSVDGRGGGVERLLAVRWGLRVEAASAGA